MLHRLSETKVQISIDNKLIGICFGITYNYYLKMDNQEGLNIFFEQKHTQTLHQPTEKEEPLPESLPYLQRGDSSMYLDQFLAKNQPEQQVLSPQKHQNKEDSNSAQKDQDYSISQRAKFTPSSFHNFQKHLTVCLKHSVEIKLDQRQSEDYREAAARLWKVFKQSAISTKKVLHYLLGQRNEHKITDAGLKEFGLLKIYEEYNDKVMKEARNYLASETLRQIRQGKLSQYIESKKLKDKEKFKKYVEIFVEELEQGFLRKRLPKDKVYELQRC